VDKVDGGPKGIIVSFRDNAFSNPAALVRYVAEQKSFAKVRPDMKVVFLRETDDPARRLRVTSTILKDLVKLAEGKQASAVA
jgi:transcription-repair coupling factor (superfamily II helicase)